VSVKRRSLLLDGINLTGENISTVKKHRTSDRQYYVGCSRRKRKVTKEVFTLRLVRHIKSVSGFTPRKVACQIYIHE
jgi:hypothetical protein